MNIIVVDNNQSELEQTRKCLQTIFPDALVISFYDAMEAVRYGYNHAVDMLYTEVIMRHITGFDVVRLIRKEHPDVKTYFLSDTVNFLKYSIANEAVGYYLKPIDEETLLNENEITETTIKEPIKE